MPGIRKLTQDIKRQADPKQAAILQGFFKTAPGQYGAGDIFLGLTVPQQRQIAQRYSDLDRTEISRLLNSKIHEFRLVALLILVEQYKKASDLAARKILADFYLRNTKRINNWDLVDLTAPKILGEFLWEYDRARSGAVPAEVGRRKLSSAALLNKLASSRNLWERRIAIVATYAFIRRGQAALTFKIAKSLLADDHDLIHKAVGWMLREVGKRVKEEALLDFLDQNYRPMRRTALRYALERLSPERRLHYLTLSH